MGRVERQREIARKRTRRAKLRKIRSKYAAATDSGTKTALVAKLRRVSPFVDLEAPVEEAKPAEKKAAKAKPKKKA